MVVNLELFNRVFELSQTLIGYDTYDALPMYNVDYPFVVVDNIQSLPINFKTKLAGRITVSVHIWGTVEMRAEVADALDKLMLLDEIQSDNYEFKSRFNENNFQILNDTSVENTQLIHGVATLVFDWFKKRKGNK